MTRLVFNRYTLYRSLVVLVENAVSASSLTRSKILDGGLYKRAKSKISAMEDSSNWTPLQNMFENNPLELVGLMPALARDDGEVAEAIWKQVLRLDGWSWVLQGVLSFAADEEVSKIGHNEFEGHRSWKEIREFVDV